MITPDMIPDAVVEKMARARAIGRRPNDDLWNDLMTDARNELAAALSAWPGAGTVTDECHAGVRRKIILPLPTDGGR